MSAELTAAKGLLARLVAFDTTSHKSNLSIVRFVQDYLHGHGIESTLVPTADGQKASLFATIGPAGVPGVGLSGHTDVVPVAGQSWDTDPFTMVADTTWPRRSSTKLTRISTFFWMCSGG